MLKISKNVELTDIVSEGNLSNPLSTQHPITGSAVSVLVWLFNNDATKRYESINIDPIDATDTDESTWVQLAPDVAGVAGTYLAASEALPMANVTSANVGVPFWVKLTSPVVAETQNKTDIKLQTNYTEFAV